MQNLTLYSASSYKYNDLKFQIFFSHDQVYQIDKICKINYNKNNNICQSIKFLSNKLVIIQSYKYFKNKNLKKYNINNKYKLLKEFSEFRYT